MLKGARMEPHLVPGVLSLYLLFIHLCLAAPGQPGTQREQSEDSSSPPSALLNPFGSGQKERSLLQSHVQSSAQKSESRPEISSWEQAVFFLFGLYDYDRSGFLDGLEMMKLLSDYNSHHAPEASEPVVSMVDFLLQTHDVNQDGLLHPSELLSASLAHAQGTIHDATTKQENEVDERMKPQENTDLEEEPREKIPPPEDDQPPSKVMSEVEEVMEQTDEPEQIHDVPVHQGQPEI